MKFIKKFKRKNVSVSILETADQMGWFTARQISKQLKSAFQDGRIPVLWLMAAPSAFPFYKAFLGLLKEDGQLRKAVCETQFFQFDDYPVSRKSDKFKVTFRCLLEENLFNPITETTGIIPNTNPLELVEDESQNEAVCRDYAEKLFALKENGAYLIQLKGIGMDGHWGFHSANTPLETAAGIIRVPMESQNIRQQMLDWPEYFKTREDVPDCAYTFDVQAFLKADVIFDNVPQKSKEFAVLATYANATVINEIPSTAIKNHEHSQVFLTEDAGRALIEYMNEGSVSPGTIKRLNELWGDENEESENTDIGVMNCVLRKIGILT